MAKAKTAAQPVPTSDKPKSITRLIREMIVTDESASNATIAEQLAQLGHTDVKVSTISTLKADTSATLRVLRDLGMLRSRPRQAREAVAAPEPVTGEVTEVA